MGQESPQSWRRVGNGVGGAAADDVVEPVPFDWSWMLLTLVVHSCYPDDAAAAADMSTES
jgi:hypothetical protein